MDNLQIEADGKSIRPFQIRHSKDFPMLYLEASGEATITFHRSIDGVTFTPHKKTVTFTNYLHEPLYDLKVGEFVKITSDANLYNPKIMW